MAEVFTWQRKAGATGKITFRTNEVQFGDGYQQVIKDGINNVVQTWPMSFEGDEMEMQPIYDFFVRHAGATAFFWTPPGGVQSLWRVKEFSMTSIGAGLYSVTAEFKQAFRP